MEKEKSGSEHHEGVDSARTVVVALDDTTDRHAVLKTILEQRPLSPWSRGAFRLYAICLLIYLCSTMNGQRICLNPYLRRLTASRLRRLTYGLNKRSTKLH